MGAKKSIVNDILTYNQLHDLWGAGFTIVRRNPDPYEIDAKLIPRGMVYQWNPTQIGDGSKVVQPQGWTPVPHARHPGVFAPWGEPGDVIRDGLALSEKPVVVVELHRAAAKAAAEKLVSDWAERAKADGLTGFTKVGDDKREVGEAEDFVQIGATKTIETTVAIPRDMAEHMAAIFAERDRMESAIVRDDRTLESGPIADKFYAEMDANKAAPWWPTLRAIILPIAIDNVRANLKKDTTDE